MEPLDTTKIEFSVTPNSWINNGLIRLAQQLQLSGSDATVIIHPDKVIIESIANKKLDVLLCEALHNAAADGTYNFSTSLKFLNQRLKSGYSRPKPYPDSENDFNETIEITDKERELLKKEKNEANPQKKQQVWKQRLSFIASGRYAKPNYLNIGLNLQKNNRFVESLFDSTGKKSCPLCGYKTSKLIKVQQQFNPLTSEHHNNVVEGYSKDIRQKISACPKCMFLCYFSFFNKNIPFFQVVRKDVYLAIPNAINLTLLKKIYNNLALPSQAIDFSDASCTSYSTNIKSLPLNYRSKHASLLALLHNIKNKYSMPEPEALLLSFKDVERKEFLEIIEWLFISKSFKIAHIRADERIYDLLERFKDPKNNDDVYLVPDFLANFSFTLFDENIVDRFFEGILKFDLKNVSYGLFHMAKVSADKPNKIYQRFRPGGNSPLQLFEKLFLPKILEAETMIDENLRNACIDVAKSIGHSFSENVGMMTKFAYASDPREFKLAVEDATFRLAKQSALEKGKSNYVSEESLKLVFDSLTPEQFSDIKNYFVSFMSVAALSKNYAKGKKEE